MKLRVASLSLLALSLTLATVPALAQSDVYDNGPVDGQDLGWTINFGFTVSDSLILSRDSDVTGMQFWAWLIPGDTLTSVEVQLGAAAFGNEFLDQTVSVTASNCFSNQFGYNVCDETANWTGVALSAGTYWVTLGNASVPSGDPAYWDQNSGLSQAQENTIGTIPSESFTILGFQSSTTTGTTSTGTTPEPSSVLLFGSGFVGLAGVLRRKMKF
jgi:hypothetical protein